MIKTIEENIRGIFTDPAKLILFFIYIFLLCCLPYSAPLFLISFIAYGISRLLGVTGAKSIACGLCVWLGIFVPVAHLLARFSLYGYFPIILLLLLSVLIASYGIFKNRRKDPYAFAENSYSSGDVMSAVWPLLIVIFCLFMFARVFWITSYSNCPNPTFIQGALYMVREGKIYFAIPQLDVLDTEVFWYPNLLSHLASIGILFSNKSLEYTLIYFSILAPYLIFLGIVAWIDLFKDNLKHILIAVWLSIMIFCTYAWFVISMEISTDTPVFLIISALYVWMLHLFSKKNIQGYIGVGLTLVTVFWFRQFAGFMVIMAGLFLLFYKDWRGVLGSVFRIHKSFFIIFSLIIMLFASMWYLELYARTGNPTYPYSSKASSFLFPPVKRWPHISPMSANAYVKTEETEMSKAGIKKLLVDDLTSPTYGLLYSFFSIDQDIVHKHNYLKIARGVFFGYTIPTLVTILCLLGLIVFIKNRENKEFPDDLTAPQRFMLRISFAFVLAFVLFIHFNGFYYKMLYLLTPAILMFAYLGLLSLFKKKDWNIVFRILSVMQVLVFVFLFLMKNVGSSRENWAVPRYLIKRDTGAYDAFKAYSYYRAAQRARIILKDSNAQIMHFHPEPGEQVSLFLYRDYYWNELHYNNYLENLDLYRAKTKNELLDILRKRNIKVFVTTYLGQRLEQWQDLDPQAKHLLLILLINKDDAFGYDPPFAYLK